MPTPLTALGSLAFGAASAYLARRRGHNPYLWFILGAFFGIFGFGFLIFFVPRKVPQASQRSLDPNTIDITPKINPAHKENFWYYLDPKNNLNGPMSFDALSRAFAEGTISKNTFIWNEGLDSWQPLSDFI